jgi:catechol 2,3-dioxygenase-like lactoylglutathione lyase family enzyme
LNVRGAPRTLRLAFIESVAIVVDEYDSAISFFVNALGFEVVEDSPALTRASVASTTPAPTDACVVALVASCLLGHQNRGLVGESG